MPPKASWIAFSCALVLIVQCGGDAENHDQSNGAAGEAGSDDGGSTGSGGSETGGRSGSSGQGGTAGRGGTETSGGTAGRGGQAGRGGTAGRGGSTGGAGESGASGSGEGGSAGAGDGGGGLGGDPTGGDGGQSDGGTGGGPDCVDPPPDGACSNDLSQVGTGDLEIKFTITTSTQAYVASIVSQRAACFHSYFWAARLVAGRVYVELDDNFQAYAACHSNVVVNDGVPHRVVVRRVADQLSIVVDCGLPTICATATTDMSMPLAPLGGPAADPCIGTADGTVLLDGTVREICARPLD